jgi:hypothetical protein
MRVYFFVVLNVRCVYYTKREEEREDAWDLFIRKECEDRDGIMNDEWN